jgi:hypothetical protein
MFTLNYESIENERIEGIHDVKGLQASIASVLIDRDDPQAASSRLSTAILETISTAIENSLRHEVERAVCGATASLHSHGGSFTPPRAGHQSAALDLTTKLGDDIRWTSDEEVQNMQSRIEQFASIINGMTDIVTKMEGRLHVLEQSYVKCSNEPTEHTALECAALIRKAQDMMNQYDEERNAIESELNAIQFALKEELAKLRADIIAESREDSAKTCEEIGDLRRTLNAHIVDVANLQQLLLDDQQLLLDERMRVQQLLDADRGVTHRLDDLRGCLEASTREESDHGNMELVAQTRYRSRSQEIRSNASFSQRELATDVAKKSVLERDKGCCGFSRKPRGLSMQSQ